MKMELVLWDDRGYKICVQARSVQARMSINHTTMPLEIYAADGGEIPIKLGDHAILRIDSTDTVPWAVVDIFTRPWWLRWLLRRFWVHEPLEVQQ